jgi:hypothetical protein
MPSTGSGHSNVHKFAGIGFPSAQWSLGALVAGYVELQLGEGTLLAHDGCGFLDL